MNIFLLKKNVFLDQILVVSSIAPKPLSHKCDHFKNGFNGFAIVDYIIQYMTIGYLDSPAIRNIQWLGNEIGKYFTYLAV